MSETNPNRSSNNQMDEKIRKTATIPLKKETVRVKINPTQGSVPPPSISPGASAGSNNTKTVPVSPNPPAVNQMSRPSAPPRPSVAPKMPRPASTQSPRTAGPSASPPKISPLSVRQPLKNQGANAQGNKPSNQSIANVKKNTVKIKIPEKKPVANVARPPLQVRPSAPSRPLQQSVGAKPKVSVAQARKPQASPSQNVVQVQSSSASPLAYVVLVLSLVVLGMELVNYYSL